MVLGWNLRFSKTLNGKCQCLPPSISQSFRTWRWDPLTLSSIPPIWISMDRWRSCNVGSFPRPLEAREDHRIIFHGFTDLSGREPKTMEVRRRFAMSSERIVWFRSDRCPISSVSGLCEAFLLVAYRPIVHWRCFIRCRFIFDYYHLKRWFVRSEIAIHAKDVKRCLWTERINSDQHAIVYFATQPGRLKRGDRPAITDTFCGWRL
jgi:hypothetical protein